MSHQLNLPKTITPAAVRELLFFFIRNTDHKYGFLRNMTDGGVQAWAVVNGYPWQETIDELTADFFRAIPEFENLVSETNYFIDATSGVSGVATMRVDGVDVQTVQVVKDSTVTLRLPYLSHWLSACKARDSAIATGDIDEVLTMVTKAFSTLESFLLMRAHVFNSKNPAGQQLTDPDGQGRFVSTEDKLKKWMPVMAPHYKIDFGKSRGWTSTLRLKKLRDDVAVHAKVGQDLGTASQVASAVNDFRDLAALLFCLELAFPPGFVDAKIIRAMQHPIVSAKPQKLLEITRD